MFHKSRNARDQNIKSSDNLLVKTHKTIVVVGIWPAIWVAFGEPVSDDGKLGERLPVQISVNVYRAAQVKRKALAGVLRGDP